MNPLKAWNAKLEAGIFWPSKNLYRQCEGSLIAGLGIKTGCSRSFELDVSMHCCQNDDI